MLDLLLGLVLDLVFCLFLYMAIGLEQGLVLDLSPGSVLVLEMGLALGLEVNMVEKEQMLQYSESVSNTNGGFVVNDTNANFPKDKNPIYDIGIKRYPRNKFWQMYVRQSLVYRSWSLA